MGDGVSIIVPVYNEGERILETLTTLFTDVTSPLEILVVYDDPSDSTRTFAERFAESDSRVQPTLNTYGPGPANAIRYGIDHSRGDVVVVTTCDGSDETKHINGLVRLIQQGAVVASASRYSKGGKQLGGPLAKKLMSRLAGLSLYWFARVGTRDATNGFKAYSKPFLDAVRVEAEEGWEIALELVAKARRHRLPVAEIPTVWYSRTTGKSNFKLGKWLPGYLRWYFFAFGKRLQMITPNTPDSLQSSVPLRDAVRSHSPGK